MRHDLGCGGGGRGDHIVIGAYARAGSVIHNKPVFAQHQTIAHTPLWQGRHHIAVDKIKEPRGIRARHGDFAQSGNIDNTDRIAHIAHLAVAGLQPCCLAILWEIGRTIPQARGHHRRILSNTCCMAGGEAFGCKPFALRACANRTKGHWHKGRAVGCRSSFCNSTACGICQNRNRGGV